jgi:hypothetical protein
MNWLARQSGACCESTRQIQSTGIDTSKCNMAAQDGPPAALDAFKVDHLPAALPRHFVLPGQHQAEVVHVCLVIMRAVSSLRYHEYHLVLL